MHKIILFLIILIAFFTRTFFWFYGYNENPEVTFWTGLVIHGDGYFSYSKLFRFKYARSSGGHVIRLNSVCSNPRPLKILTPRFS